MNFYISVTVTSTVPWLLLNFSFHALGLGCRLDIGDLNIVTRSVVSFFKLYFFISNSQFEVGCDLYPRYQVTCGYKKKKETTRRRKTGLRFELYTFDSEEDNNTQCPDTDEVLPWLTVANRLLKV